VIGKGILRLEYLGHRKSRWCCRPHQRQTVKFDVVDFKVLQVVCRVVCMNGTHFEGADYESEVCFIKRSMPEL
jgi:hypothetical protein